MHVYVMLLDMQLSMTVGLIICCHIVCWRGVFEIISRSAVQVSSYRIVLSFLHHGQGLSDYVQGFPTWKLQKRGSDLSQNIYFSICFRNDLQLHNQVGFLKI